MGAHFDNEIILVGKSPACDLEERMQPLLLPWLKSYSVQRGPRTATFPPGVRVLGATAQSLGLMHWSAMISIYLQLNVGEPMFIFTKKEKCSILQLGARHLNFVSLEESRFHFEYINVYRPTVYIAG